MIKSCILSILFTFGLLALLQGEPAVSEGYKGEIKVSPLLRTSETVAGQPIAYPETQSPEVTAVSVEIPPGTQTGWHKHPFPCYGYILTGELTVEMEDGKTHKANAGEALVESVNLLHNGKNEGAEPVRLIMFVTGSKDQPFTVKGNDPR